MTRKWEDMKVGDVIERKEQVEEEIRTFINEKIRELGDELELNATDIYVSMKYVEVGFPPYVVQVRLTMPFHKGYMGHD